MKVRFHCANKLSEKHDKDIELTDIILWPWPTCCGVDMRPVDEAEWRKISKALMRANIELQQAGLPSLAGMLCHTEGRHEQSSPLATDRQNALRS